MSDPESVFTLFLATWVPLMVDSFFMFYISRDVGRKRRLFPWFNLIAGVLFVGFVWVAGFPIGVVLVSIPLVALITWLNTRQIRFCDACGKTATSMSLGGKPRYCQQCGASVDGPTNQ